ncbi:MAG: hypothetical protein WC889_14960 [Myxococcota bacterium]|jgi:hypothetical protein
MPHPASCAISGGDGRKRFIPGEMPMNLTAIEVMDDDMARVLRTKSPAERLKIAGMLFNSAKKLISSSLRLQFPLWDEKTVAEETLARVSRGSY